MVAYIINTKNKKILSPDDNTDENKNSLPAKPDKGGIPDTEKKNTANIKLINQLVLYNLEK